MGVPTYLRVRTSVGRTTAARRGAQLTRAGVQMLLLGQISANGTLTSRMQGRFNDTWGIKVESRMSNEQGGSMQVMGDLEGGGGDWLGQVKLGTAGFYGANYMQSITPTLSAGGELFYLSHGCKSGAGAALRHANEKCIATMQVCCSPPPSLSPRFPLHRTRRTDFSALTASGGAPLCRYPSAQDLQGRLAMRAPAAWCSVEAARPRRSRAPRGHRDTWFEGAAQVQGLSHDRAASQA